MDLKTRASTVEILCNMGKTPTEIIAGTGIDPVLLMTASMRKFDVSIPDELAGAIIQNREAQKQAVMCLFGLNSSPVKPDNPNLEKMSSVAGEAKRAV